MDFFMEKKKDILIIILIVIIIGLGGLIFAGLNRKEDNNKDEVIIEKKEDLSIEENTEEVEVIEYYVDIKGAVKKPGVYKVTKGSIVNDQTTPNMIQRISEIFERNHLIYGDV